MGDRNNKRKPFFLKKYSKPIPELKKIREDESSTKEVIVERNVGFNTFEVTLIIIISVLFGFIVGCILNSSKSSFTGKEVPTEINEFIMTYNSILDNYYGSVNEKDLMNAAISGMVNSLDDPYSSFMNTEDTEVFNKTVDGVYVGIGVTVVSKDNRYVVVDIFDKSPAKDSGMMVGDVIVKIGKTDVSLLSLNEVAKLIRGKKDTVVKITVLRGNEELVLKVKRGDVEVTSVTGEVIEKDNKKIGYIYINSFAATTFKQFKSVLSDLEKKKISSLILDVRGNPGGHLTQVSAILEMFFDKKTVLYQIESKSKRQKVYSTTKEKREYPVVVIVNEQSASASEILASSFQDNYKNATVLGTTTYGKGTVQKAMNLSSGVSLKYTTQKWLTPKGAWINEKGVVPDVEVFQGESYYNVPSMENDMQVQKAIEILIQK